MKTCFRLLLLLVLTGGSVSADPTIEYAKETLAGVLQSEARRFAGYKGDPKLFEPDPVLLLRFNLDVTSDGYPELFLSTSTTREPAVPWRVYDGKSGRPIGESIYLDPRSLSAQKGDDKAILSQITRFPDWSYGLRSYEFRPDGAVRDLSQPLDEDQRRSLRFDQKKKVEKLGEPIRPKVELILLEQFMSDPNSPWREWEPERSIYGQVNGEDLSNLAALRSGQPQGRTAVEPLKITKSAGAVADSKPPPVASRTQHPDNPSKFSAGNWIPALLILIIASIAVAVFQPALRKPSQ